MTGATFTRNAGALRPPPWTGNALRRSTSLLFLSTPSSVLVHLHYRIPVNNTPFTMDIDKPLDEVSLHFGPSADESTVHRVRLARDEPEPTLRR